MPNRWIVKSEPSVYSFAQLQRDGRAVWDGVRNAQALIHLRAMSAGDLLMFYHSGAAKAVVGLARVAGDPYPDPAAGDRKLVVVDVVPDRALARPVTLAEIKSSGEFADLGLVRQPRLSVVPVSAGQWRRLIAISARP